MDRKFPARVIATAALVLLALTGCTPPDTPQPDWQPRSRASAEHAMLTADLPRLRDDLGKGHGLAAHAKGLAQKLEPAAWLVALGATDREYDLKRAQRAMRANDDGALADALGFGTQALTADILSAGGTVYTRSANGRSYCYTGPQPLDLLDDQQLPKLPKGCLALHAELWGRLQQRNFYLRFGLDADGLTDLQAGPELARDHIDVPARAARHEDAQQALPGGAWKPDLSMLAAPRWYGAKFTLLAPDGAMHKFTLGRDSHGWALVESTQSTMRSRLEALREERLQYLYKQIGYYRRTWNRWPRSFRELSVQPEKLCDPAAPQGRNGWAGLDARPPLGFELAPDKDSGYAVCCIDAGLEGRRAIDTAGRLLWLKS